MPFGQPTGPTAASNFGRNRGGTPPSSHEVEIDAWIPIGFPRVFKEKVCYKQGLRNDSELLWELAPDKVVGRDGQTIEWNDHLFRKQRLHWQPNVEKNILPNCSHDSNYFPGCLQVPTWAGGGQQYFHREFKQILAWNPSQSWEDLHDAAPLDIDIPAPHIRAIHDISRTISKGWHIGPEHYIFT